MEKEEEGENENGHAHGERARRSWTARAGVRWRWRPAAGAAAAGRGGRTGSVDEAPTMARRRTVPSTASMSPSRSPMAPDAALSCTPFTVTLLPWP